MARIFISHSSQDNLEAVAMRDWLVTQGWGKQDIFLDLDKENGILAGERWQKALVQAADRCEAVLILITASWIASSECLTEFYTSQNSNRRIFGVLIKPVGIDNLPAKLRAEWQLTRLVGDGPKTSFVFTHQAQTHNVQWLSDGLESLRNGLLRAGVSADHFPWPPEDEKDRSPYRSLGVYEEQDAAIYFGRDAQILGALGNLSGMRDSGDEQLFVILGASGTGKSSFLRAGLIPRLKRDDRNFLPLKVVRPLGGAITGKQGLAAAILSAWPKRGEKRAFGDIKEDLLKRDASVFVEMLLNIQTDAFKKFQVNATEAHAPTLVLAVDQAEELFSSHDSESQKFLEIVSQCLKENKSPNPLLIVACTIRTDRSEWLLNAPLLTGIKSYLFGLKPISREYYERLITGPAEQATKAGNRLVPKPDLIAELLDDFSKSGNPLPLLSLTLATLADDAKGGNGDLLLYEYKTLGRISGVIDTILGSVLSPNDIDRDKQLRLLHRTFIPHLVQINPLNNQPIRRQALLTNLNPEAQLLITELVEKRLLTSDITKGGETIEIAHDALFNEWRELKKWLDDERENIKLKQVLQQDAKEWQENKNNPAWLWKGVRLQAAEKLQNMDIYENEIKDCGDFIKVSRSTEKLELEEKEYQLRKVRKRSRMLAMAVVFLLGLGIWGAIVYNQSQARFKAVTGLYLLQELKNYELEKSWLLLLAANQLTSSHIVNEELANQVHDYGGLKRLINTGSPVNELAASVDDILLVIGDSCLLFDLDKNQSTGLPLNDCHERAVNLNGVDVIEFGVWRRLLAATFNHDGQRIAIGGGDGLVQIWNVNTREPVGEPFVAHQGPVTSIAFNKNGSLMVSAGDDRKLKLWDPKSYQFNHEIYVGTEISSVAISSDGAQLIAACGDYGIHSWNAETRSQVEPSYIGHKSDITKVIFNSDGNIISASKDATVRIWNAKNTASIPLKGHSGSVLSLATNRDGSRIVTGDSDKALRIWDASSGDLIGQHLRGHDKLITGVAFLDSNGRQVVSGSIDGTLRVWDTDSFSAGITKSSDESSVVTSVAFNSDGTRLISANNNGEIEEWDTKTGSSIGAKWITDEELNLVSYSPDDTKVVTGSDVGILSFWTAEGLHRISHDLIPIDIETNWIKAYSPDGTRIATASNEGTIHILDVETVKEATAAPLNGHDGYVESVAFNFDGSRLVSGGWDDNVYLWDARIGNQIGKPLVGHKDSVKSVAFSSDGKYILSGSVDGTLLLWDAETKKQIGQPLEGHTESVTSVAFSPNGKYFISGSRDKTLRVWDLKTAQPIATLRQDASITSVSVSHDGSLFAFGTNSGSVRIYSAPDAWPVELCKKLTRNMSRQEWREWVSPDIKYIKQCPDLPIPPNESLEKETVK